MAKIRLDSGVTLEGTTEELSEVLKKLKVEVGKSGFYYSSTRDEYIPVSEMSTVYLKNALLKMYREWVEQLRFVDAKDLVLEIINGNNDPTWIAMLRELALRKD